MKVRQNPRIRQFYIAFVNVAVLMILMVVYFTVYIPSRKEQVTQRKFDALRVATDQFARNLEDNHRLIRVATNVQKQVLENLLQKELIGSSTKDAKIKAALAESSRLITSAGILPGKMKSGHVLEDDVDADSFRLAGVQVEKVHYDSFAGQFVLADTYSFDLIFFSDTIRSGLVMEYPVHVQSVVQDLLPEDEFDGYMVFRKKKMPMIKGGKHDDSSDRGSAEEHELIYQSERTNLIPAILDSLMSDASQLNRGVVEVPLNGKDYLLVNYYINGIQGLEGWSICGLISKAKYLEQTRALPMLSVYLLLTIGLLVLFMLPIIKLQVIGQYERIHVSDVSWSIASLVLGTALIFLLLGHVFHSEVSAQRLRKRHLTELSKSMQADFGNELDDLRTCLRHADGELLPLIWGSCIADSNRGIMSELSIQPERALVTDGSGHPLQCDSIEALQRFKQNVIRFHQKHTWLRDICWLNSKGDQIIKWSIDSNLRVKINVSERPYFKRMMEALSESNSTKDNLGFFLESTRTWVSREKVCVLSMPSTSSTLLSRIPEKITHRLDQVTERVQKVIENDIQIDSSDLYIALLFQDTTYFDSLSNELYDTVWSEEIVGVDTVSITLDERTDTISPKIVSATVRLGSLFNTLLPEGYEFAVIRKEDEQVLFHSDETHNLRGPLIGKDVAPSEYYSSLASGESSEFEAMSHGKRQYMLMQPLLPGRSSDLFLVTMVNSRHFDSTLSLALSTTLTFLILFFGLFTLLMVLIWVMQRSPSMLRAAHLPFAWLRPISENSEKYRRVLVHQLFTILFLLTAYIFSNKNFELILLVVVSNLHTFWANYIIIHEEAYETNVWRAISGALRRKRSIIILFVVLELMLLMVSFNHTASLWIPTYVVMFLLVFGLVHIHTFSQRISRWFSRLDYNYVKEYRLQAMSWIMICGGFTTLIFYQVALRFEERTMIRFTQEALLNSLQQRPAYIENHENDSTGVFGCYSGLYYDSCIAFSDTSVVQPREGAADDSNTFSHVASETSESDSLLEELVAWMRPILFDHHTVRDNSHFYERSKFKITNPKERLHTSKDKTIPVGGDKPLKPVIKQVEAVYKIPVPWRENGELAFNFTVVLLWMFFALGGLFVYRLLKFTVSRIFTVQFPLPTLKKNFDQEVIVGREELKRIFWVGLPHSGRLHYLKDKYGQEEVMVLDLSEIVESAISKPETDWTIPENESIQTLVLTGLEYRFKDEEVNRIKLTFLEWLERAWQGRIVISSFLHPGFFMELYEEKLANQAAIKDKREEQQERRMEHLRNLRNDYYRIIAVFQPYYRVYHPLFTSSEGAMSFADRDQPLVRLVKQECNNGWFLIRLGEALLTGRHLLPNSGDEVRDHEDMILKIQGLAQSYYRSIWDGLTWEEKLIVYDLADDGLVNAKNIPVLSNLVSLGLVRIGERLMLMNDSFRNFVLTIIKPEDALRLELESKRFGNWNLVRWPLMSLAVVLLIFIFVIQPHVFESVIGLGTGLAAGLPFLFRLLADVNFSRGGRAIDS